MPEEKSVGKALRKALGLETVKFDVEPRVGGTSRLMNPRRLAIFEHLWKNPCSHIRQISRATKIPVESLKWHLRMLERSELIGALRSERRVAFYPKGLIREDDVELFAQLSNTKRREIVRILWEKPEGTELNEISSAMKLSKQALHHHISILENLSVVKGLKEGRRAKYRLDKNVDKLKRLYQRRSGKLLKWLLSSLENECLNPEVVKKDEEAVKVRVSLGVKKSTMEFQLNPFSNIL